MPLLDYPPIEIVKDMTTSQETKFERVYQVEIADEVAESSHLISRTFVGEDNTGAERTALARQHRNTFNAFESGTPRLLDDYSVSVKEDPNDSKAVLVNIGADIKDTMDTVEVNIAIGDIVRGVQFS